jgi:hypothetical protein
MLASSSPRSSNKDSPMPPLSSDQIIALLQQCDERTEQEGDELLHDLLVHSYPTRSIQDS